MYASKHGHFKIAKFLIENNADINIQNKVFFFYLFLFNVKNLNKNIFITKNNSSFLFITFLY
jgi:ankyrin repeat protein